MTMGPKKHCKQIIIREGEKRNCAGWPTKYDPEYCIFHSKKLECVTRMKDGRMKGASMPERRRQSLSRAIGFQKINSTKDLLNWLNRLNADFYHARVGKEDVVIFLQIASGFSKVLETKEVSEELQALKDQIETLEGGTDVQRNNQDIEEEN